MLRTAVTIAVLVILLLVVGPVGLFAAWVSGSPRPLYFLTFRGVRLLAWVAGIRLEVRGRERLDAAQNYLFVANHQSNLDPPLLLLATDRNIRALAKASVFRMPVFGSVMRSASFIPVQRNDRERAVRAVDEAAAALAAGHDFIIFAEGTRSRDGRLLPFKKGPFVMAIKAQVPVVPAVLTGTAPLMSKGDWRIRPGRVTIEFLEPVASEGLGFADRNEFRDRVRDLMAAVLEPPVASDCIEPVSPVT